MGKKLAVAAVILLVLALGAGYYAASNAGRLIKAGIETVGPKILGAEVKVAKISLSPLSGSGKISGVVIGNPKGFHTPTAFELGSVDVGLNLQSVFSDKIHVRHVRIREPKITYETGRGGSNFDALLANVEKFAGPAGKSSTSASPGKQTKLQLDAFSLTGAQMSVTMKAFKGKTATLPLPPIELDGMGQGPEGITPGEAVKKVLGAVAGAAKKSLLKAGGPERLLGEGKKMVGEAKASAQKAVGAVKKLFGK